MPARANLRAFKAYFFCGRQKERWLWPRRQIKDDLRLLKLGRREHHLSQNFLG